MLKFLKLELPTAICLIERTADDLINFQAVVKKRLSKFGLLKCCEIFQQRSQKDFVSNEELFKCCRKFSFQYKTDYCATELCVCSEAYSNLCEKSEVKLPDGTWRTNLQSLQSVYCGIREISETALSERTILAS